MSRNNDVFSVMVAKSFLATVNKEVGDLTPGQIGVFDAETNKSLIATSALPKEFYLAVGIADVNNSNLLGNIKKSAGQIIQRDNIRYYQVQPYTAGKPEIVEISDIKSNCNGDFGIKLEFRNQKIYNQQGYNQFSKSYVVKTPDCNDDCELCQPQDPNLLVKLLVEAINLDKDGLVKAEAINPTDNSVITDLDTFITTNKAVNIDNDKTNDKVAKIRLTTQPLQVYRFLDINLKYYKPRETVMLATLIADFEGKGTVTVTQEPVFEQGSGYDVRMREYKAMGWEGSPYKVSEVTNTAIGDFNYLSDVATKYHRINLTYDQSSIGGWQEYLNNLATEIYFPVSNKVEADKLIAVLDKFVSTGIKGQTGKLG